MKKSEVLLKELKKYEDKWMALIEAEESCRE